MPGFNRKGPAGEGPMTGRKMGRCTNYGESLKKKTNKTSEEPDNDRPQDLPGRGIGNPRGGRGRGRGRGYGRGRMEDDRQV